jgi:hypothetical protein
MYLIMAIKKDTPKENIIDGNSPTCEKMVGEKFGRLTILKYIGYRVLPKGYKQQLVEAKCDCGSVHNYVGAAIRNGVSTSCGCFQFENSINLHTKHGQKSTKYGKRGTILYARWRSMFDRVRSDKNYKHVKISDRWQGENGFINFCKDMGEIPTPKHTLDRYPNQRGNYEPSNCRWATQMEQCNNFSRNVHIIYNGERLTLAQSMRKYNLTRSHVRKLRKEQL